MQIRLPLVLAATVLLAACQTPPATTPQQAADMCHTFRGYLSSQPYVNVMESCTRQLGEAACRQCLSR